MLMYLCIIIQPLLSPLFPAAFANVCNQSTDFHFQDIDVQLSQIQECALIGNTERQEQSQLTESMSSQTSDSQLSHSASSHSFTSPDRNVTLLEQSNGTLSSAPNQRGQGEERRTSTLLDTTSVSLEPG